MKCQNEPGVLENAHKIMRGGWDVGNEIEIVDEFRKLSLVRDGGADPLRIWVDSGMLGQFPENGMMVPVFLEWKRNAL